MAALVLGYAGLMACLFIVQGTCILKAKDIRGILAGIGALPNSAERPKLAMVVGCAAIYIVSGLALGCLVVVALFKRHTTPPTLPQPSLSSVPHLLGPSFLVLVSSWALAKPSGILGWVKQSYPQIDVNDAFLRAIVRVCAAGCLAVGVAGLVAFA